MKYGIIVQNGTGFQVDWEKMFGPQKHKLFLIVNRAMFPRNPIHQLKYFEQIIILDEVNQETVEAAVRKLLLSLDHPQNVYLMTNDEHCMITVAEVRARLNIGGDSKETIEAYINKDKMKHILSKAGIRTPRYDLFQPEAYRNNPQDYLDDLLKKIPLPLFIKPIDGAGSEMATKITTRSELQLWCDKQQFSQRIFEIDEFIDGILFHCDTVIQNHEIIWQDVSQYNIPCHLFASGIPLTSWVLADSDLKIKLKSFASQVLQALPPLSGNATHMEIFLKADGELIFLEVAARAPGGRAVRAYEKYCGFNIEEAHFNLQMGYSVSYQPPQQTFASAWVLYPGKDMVVNACVEPQIASHYSAEWACRIGDQLVKSNEIEHRVCLLILWNNNRLQLMSDLEHLCNTHQCVV